MGFNPQPYQGTQYLAQGFQGLGQGLGNGLQNLLSHMEQKREEEKNINTSGKAIKTLFKANPDLAGLAGLQPEQIEGLGSRDAIAAFSQATKAQTLKGLAQEQQQRQQQMEQAQQQQMAEAEAMQRFSAGPPALAQLNQARTEGSPFGLSDYAPQLAAPANDMERLRHAASTPGLNLHGLQALSGLARNMSEMQQNAGSTPLGLGQLMPVKGAGTFVGTGGAPHFIPDAKPEQPPKLYPALDPGTGKPIPGMALKSDGSAVQTGEKGGLKDLSQTEVDRLGALDQAAKDMDRIEALFSGISNAGTGPVV